MRALQPAEILHAWEVGSRQIPQERALTLLGMGWPECPRDQLATLSIGVRDAHLFELRRHTFGDSVQAFAECPRCAERLELHFAASELCQTLAIGPEGASGAAFPRSQPATVGGEMEGTPNRGTGTTAERNPALAEHVSDRPAAAFCVEAGGFVVRFRLPTSADLTSSIATAGPGTAHRELLQRCVLDASRDGGAVPASELPPEVCDAIQRRMAEADPAAEVALALRCPACAHSWSALLDIAAFFWTELAAAARRLLREVDALARAYGWCEGDILALSATRRQAYLELLGV